MQYFDSFIEGSNLFIIMEYVQNGTLSERLKNQRGRRLAERAIWRYFLQARAAFFFCSLGRFVILPEN